MHHWGDSNKYQWYNQWFILWNNLLGYILCEKTRSVCTSANLKRLPIFTLIIDRTRRGLISAKKIWLDHMDAQAELHIIKWLIVLCPSHCMNACSVTEYCLSNISSYISLCFYLVPVTFNYMYVVGTGTFQVSLCLLTAWTEPSFSTWISLSLDHLCAIQTNQAAKISLGVQKILYLPV